MNPPPAETAAWFLAQPAAFHEKWMAMALAEARATAEEGEVPMGSVVVRRLPDGTARPVGRARPECSAAGPALRAVGPGHAVACPFQP